MRYISCIFAFILIAGPACAANFPPEIVRPASGIGESDRIYRAYPGIEYEIRAAVFGGMYPFQYSLENEPEGMTVDDQGIIRWPDPQSDAGPIVLHVTDSEGTTVTSNWSINVTTQGFYFVDAQEPDGGDGSLQSPWNDWRDFYLGREDPTYDDSMVYFFNGNYTYPSEFTGSTAGSSNRLDIENNHPNAYLAYPGEEEVYFDGEKDTNRIHLHVRTTNAYFKDINFRNGYGFFLEMNAGDYQRILDCTFKENNGSGSASNQGSISFRGDAAIQENPPESDESFKIYPVIQGCDFRDSYQNENGIGELFGIRYVVIEDNSFMDLANFGVAVKSTTDKVMIRNNTFDTSKGVGVFGQYYSNNTEISFNSINAETALEMGRCTDNTGPIDIYRNTILGHFYFRSIEEGFGPFTISNNVVVNSDTFSGEHTHVRHLPEDHWSINADVAIFNDNLMGYPEDNMVDSAGRLTEEYSGYLGTHGWELDTRHEADTDNNGTIETSEIRQYVDLWTGNSIQITDLLEAIGLWKS